MEGKWIKKIVDSKDTTKEFIFYSYPKYKTCFKDTNSSMPPKSLFYKIKNKDGSLTLG